MGRGWVILVLLCMFSFHAMDADCMRDCHCTVSSNCSTPLTGPVREMAVAPQCATEDLPVARVAPEPAPTTSDLGFDPAPDPKPKLPASPRPPPV